MSTNAPRSTLLTWLLGLLVLAAALGVRLYYLHEFGMIAQPAGGVWQVQGRGLSSQVPDAAEMDQLIKNLKDQGLPAGYQCRSPLGPDRDEFAGHRAPLYPFFRAGIELLADKVNEYVSVQPLPLVRGIQAVLGAFTCLLYYLIAWRAFGRYPLLALLVGLATAVYPVWIINVAELEDGVLASFLLAWSLYVGISAGQQGGGLRGLLLGLLLAALCLTRAALLPFAIVIQLWYCLRCRQVKSGAVSALLMVLAFLGGLTPWVLHCYQTYQQPVPVVTSAWFHLWVGNNPKSDGAEYQWNMKKPLEEADKALLAKLEQTPSAERYTLLADTVWQYVRNNPTEAVKQRFKAAVQFLLGSTSFSSTPLLFWPGTDAGKPPGWLNPVLLCSLAGMFLLALLGWRWSYGWKQAAGPFALAIFWIPLPYLLSHADMLHGSRLPLDGVLITLACIGLMGLIPLLGQPVLAGEEPAPST